MFCPQCGQQQVSGVVRFCSRCGFPLDGVSQILANGGMLPVYTPSEGGKEISARRRGVRQGVILLLTGAVLVPILGVLTSFAQNSTFLEILVAIAAILCFVGGPLRMLYAAIFEEGAPQRPHFPQPSYAPPAMPVRSPLQGHTPASLPPPPANPAGAWRSRPKTAELVQPPSITENTTRLLEKDESKDR
jgi:hypothetical protein